MVAIKVEEEELRCKECNGTGWIDKVEKISQGFGKSTKLTMGYCENCGGTGYDPDVPMEKRNTRIRD